MITFTSMTSMYWSTYMYLKKGFSIISTTSQRWSMIKFLSCVNCTIKKQHYVIFLVLHGNLNVTSWTVSLVLKETWNKQNEVTISSTWDRWRKISSDLTRTGIEPGSPGWQSDTLPYRHKSRLVQQGRTSVYINLYPVTFSPTKDPNHRECWNNRLGELLLAAIGWFYVGRQMWQVKKNIFRPGSRVLRMDTISYYNVEEDGMSLCEHILRFLRKKGGSSVVAGVATGI